ncbi:MAG TPA: hypothetical protein VIU29_00490, partial [Candidatus Deferrimicrobiaceae bacterium]
RVIKLKRIIHFLEAGFSKTDDDVYVAPDPQAFRFTTPARGVRDENHGIRGGGIPAGFGYGARYEVPITATWRRDPT